MSIEREWRYETAWRVRDDNCPTRYIFIYARGTDLLWHMVGPPGVAARAVSRSLPFLDVIIEAEKMLQEARNERWSTTVNDHVRIPR